MQMIDSEGTVDWYSMDWEEGQWGGGGEGEQCLKVPVNGLDRIMQ